MQNNQLVSTSRLPLDHFLSGALIGAITSVAMSYAENKHSDIKVVGKRAFKIALSTGISTAAGISASNSIVKGNYLNATLSAALAVGSIILIFNKEEK